MFIGLTRVEKQRLRIAQRLTTSVSSLTWETCPTHGCLLVGEGRACRWHPDRPEKVSAQAGHPNAGEVRDLAVKHHRLAGVVAHLPTPVGISVVIAMDEGDAQSQVEPAQRLQDLPEEFMEDVDVTDKHNPARPQLGL